MPKSKLQKMKLLFLLELLREDSDEEHPLKTAEIIARLAEKGVSCDRRTLAKDIALLNDQGYEVMAVTCQRQKAYYIEDRSFSLPELRILMDAVQAARFITKKKTEELTGKIAALGGSNLAQLLKQNTVHFNDGKYSNEAVYYTVNTLSEALSQGKAASFYYYDLNENRERVYHRNKRRYVVEPVALVYSENRYYLMAISPDREGASVYRIDRIEQAEVEQRTVSAAAKRARAKVPAYAGRAFKMFSGEDQKVTLVFNDNLVGAILDRFGEDVSITRLDEGSCQCTVTVQISPPFWGWLFQYDTRIRPIAPKALKEQYIQRLEKVIEMMKEQPRA